MNEPIEKPSRLGLEAHPWSEHSGFRIIFDALLAIALIIAGISFIQRTFSVCNTAITSTSVSASAGVVGGEVASEPEDLDLEPIPGTLTKIPVWVKILIGYICILIAILALLIAWLLYQLGRWLESHERRCKGKKKWWKKLLCWLVTILKWLTWITAVAVIIAGIILMIYCIIQQVRP